MTAELYQFYYRCGHGRPQDFFQGGGTFPEKVDDLFLVVALKTQVLTVTANAQNTLQHFRGKRGKSPLLPLPVGTHGSGSVKID